MFMGEAKSDHLIYMFDYNDKVYLVCDRLQKRWYCIRMLYNTLAGYGCYRIKSSVICFICEWMQVNFIAANQNTNDYHIDSNRQSRTMLLIYKSLSESVF